MKTKILATLGAAALAVGVSATASNAQIISQPGETMGLAFGAPLPEGVFFVDYENYGRRDGQDAGLGVNIPIIAWATPFSFYDTRIEVLYAAPFTHTDGSINTPAAPNALAGALNRVDVYSQALLLGAAHDFGNGFNWSLFAGPRTPDNFTNAGRGVGADIRTGISYVKNGWNASLTFAYSGNFGGVTTAPGAGFDDNIYVDYTLTHKFDKFEFGVVGFAQTDIGGPVVKHAASVAIGPYLGYDFGKFTIGLYGTREVAIRNGGYGLGAAACGAGLGYCNAEEWRGYFRIIVPLYVAPAAAPVVARY